METVSSGVLALCASTFSELVLEFLGLLHQIVALVFQCVGPLTKVFPLQLLYGYINTYVDE